jgi:hypothetical protein
MWPVRSIIFSTLSISQAAQFSEEKTVEHTTCVLIFSLVSIIYHSKKKLSEILHLQMSSCKALFICVRFKKTRTFSTDVRKKRHTKFHGNPSRGSRVVSCGRTDRQTDWLAGWLAGRHTVMTKLLVSFRNFTSAPNARKNVTEGRQFLLVLKLAVPTVNTELYRINRQYN